MTGLSSLEPETLRMIGIPASRPASRPASSSAAGIIGMAVLAIAFGGCSADDIQLEGKVFDVMGMGTNSKKAAEPVMAARSPLIMPPNSERLPEPGKPAGGEAADIAAINDPDRKLEISRADLERQQAEYCKVNYEQAKQRGDQTTADLAEGPLGSCRGSVLNIVGFGGAKEAADQ